MSNTDDPKKKPAAGGPPHISDLILGSLKPRTGKETSRWIAGLADEAVKETAEAASREPEKSVSSSHQNIAAARGACNSLVDHLFDCFQQYEYDFNRTVMGTEFVCTVERPNMHTETIKQRFQASESVQVFRGRVSTRYWTLIVRAWNEQVDGWIIPVEQIFSFRADDETYPPFLHIEPVANREGELVWKVWEVPIPWAGTRKLAKEIFSALIRVARGEAQPTDKFIIRTQDSAEPAPEPAPTPMGFEDKSSGGLPSGAHRKFELQKPELQKPEPLFQKPKAEPSPGRQTQQRAMTRKAAEAAAAAQAAEPTMDAVVELLNRVIARELEKLSASGAEAFSRQDLAGVERNFRRTTRLKELHAQMGAALVQWKQAIKEASES